MNQGVAFILGLANISNPELFRRAFATFVGAITDAALGQVWTLEGFT